jgi:hypothetical protein
MKERPFATNHLQILWVLALAAGLLLLSWPRLRASVLYLPVDTAIARHWAGETIEAGQLRALAGRAQAALLSHDHYRYWDGLSLLYYLQGMETGTPLAQRRKALEASVAAGVETIRRAPMKPMTWLRIAAARAGLHQPGDAVVTALKMSIYTGRVEPVMLPLRLQIGYAHLRFLDAEARQLLRDQTLLTWRLQKRQFVGSIRSGSIRFSDVEQLLAGSHNDVLAEMEAEIVRIFG